jgi:hypothetical protein
MPLLTYIGFPVGFAASLIFVVWMWHVSKRIAAWRYEVRVNAFLRGARPKPPVYFRPMILHLALVIQLLLIIAFWTVIDALFHVV